MNFSNLRESDFARKEEGVNDGRKISPKPSFTTSSWSRLKDPRIVRVSKAFGGKDRHSKVCTLKGLRDRRVRLSVPTAIQLYDLQERLGLNQPSKVVDWLLNIAKHEIDELPPLQMPPLQVMLDHGVISPSKFEKLKGVKTNCNSPNWEHYQNLDKSKEIARETSEIQEGDHHQEEGNEPNGSFFKWDPSNLSLSRFRSYDHHHQEDEFHNFDTVIPSGSQLPVYFHPHDHNSGEFDPKQLNFQMLSSSSSSNFTQPLYTINQGMRPFDLSMNPKLFSSQDNDGNDSK